MNVVDINKLRLYQQLVIYFIPILGNMQVVSILILMVRFYWFTKHLKAKAGSISQPHRSYSDPVRGSIDVSADLDRRVSIDYKERVTRSHSLSGESDDMHDFLDVKYDGYRTPVAIATDELSDKPIPQQSDDISSLRRPATPPGPGLLRKSATLAAHMSNVSPQTTSRITFAPEVNHPTRRSTLPIKGPFDPREFNENADRDASSEKRGRFLADPYSPRAPPGHSLTRTMSNEAREASIRYRNRQTPLARSRGSSPDRISLYRVVTNVFVLGGDEVTPGVAGVSLQRARTNSFSRERSRSRNRQRKQSRAERLMLSANAIIGRNSNFVNLSEEDRDRLGGIEYRSLKLLLKIVVAYYVSLHLIGIICLTPWIHRTDNPKYREYLASMGVNATWW